LPGGFRLKLEFTEEENLYLLTNSKWTSDVVMGFHSGHFALPAFRCREVLQIAAATDWRSALLFYTGAYVTKDDHESEMIPFLASAWEHAGLVKSCESAELAHQLLELSMDAATTWHRDQQLGWINNGEYSYRNPKTRMVAFEPGRFLKLRAFTDMLDRHS
jgi:hypothetical protein